MYACDKSDDTCDPGTDNTPSHKYIIELSERDVDALRSLKGRNGGGMTATITAERVAIWKAINQICETEKPK